MANIGTFTKTENGFVGEIVTLSFQAKNVRMVPETNGSNENAPSHRVYVGRAEIGAGTPSGGSRVRGRLPRRWNRAWCNGSHANGRSVHQRCQRR